MNRFSNQQPGVDDPDYEYNIERSDELAPGTFMRHLAKNITSQSAGVRPHLHIESRTRLAKFWYGSNAVIHYEIAVHERAGRLETGLHCEAAAERNLQLYRYFDRHMLEIQAALGPAFWLEEWDRGWIRLYETVPLKPLNLERIDEIAARLFEVIRTLQPLLEAASA